MINNAGIILVSPILESIFFMFSLLLFIFTDAIGRILVLTKKPFLNQILTEKINTLC